MMPTSEGSEVVQALRSDILNSLKTILPGAIKEVLDEIIAEYKQKLSAQYLNHCYSNKIGLLMPMLQQEIPSNNPPFLKCIALMKITDGT